MTVVASAMTGPMPAAASAARTVVLVDGVPEPGLVVRAYRADAPLDTRRAEIGVTDESLWRDRGALLHRPAVLALPHALSDGSPRWEVLVEGTLRTAGRDRRAGADERTLELVDAWADRLERPAGMGWALTPDGLATDPAAALRLGDAANRSAERYTVHGRSVHVIDNTSGEAWTLGDAIDTVAAFASIDLVTDLLPTAHRAARLSTTLDPSQPPGEVLRRLLGAAGWRVRIDRWRGGGASRGVVAVVPVCAGRVFALPWGAGAPGSVAPPGVSRIRRTDLHLDHAPPRRWVARGGRPIVEATFELVPAWDPALAGAPDAAYGRATSSDFTTYGPVFRRFVLNEDGAFTGPPYHHTPAFDLAALFDDPLVLPTPLPIGPCLVRDGAGRRLPPVVEVSTDSGATWVRYAGEARAMRERAGVVLDDAVLPAGVLAAGQGGTLRVRVTGSLRSPRALERARWRGNPFAGPGPDRLVELGEAYGLRRVDASSIHADALDLGELDADEADDRRALERALLERMSREPGGARADGRVELIGAWPGVAPGDRLADLGGPGVGADGVPSAVADTDALPRVASVRVRFGTEGGPAETRVDFAGG